MALRDVRIQLEIDTGAGILCPCSEDHFITAAVMSLYLAAGIDFDALHNQSACLLGLEILDALPKLYAGDPQRPTLDALLRDCLMNPGAVLQVIEVGQDGILPEAPSHDARIEAIEARLARIEAAVIEGRDL